MAKTAAHRTPLGLFVRDRKIKPEHLTGESGLRRTSINRFLFDPHRKPRVDSAAAVVAALRRILGENIRAQMFWDLGDGEPLYGARSGGVRSDAQR